MDFLHLIYVFFACLIGEIFGVIFGGGGFLIQPALLAGGVEPKIAVANDIVAAAFASAAFLLTYRPPDKTTYKKAKKIMLWMVPGLLCGAYLGGNALNLIPSEIMRWVILIICAAGFVYNAMNVRKSDLLHEAEKSFAPFWPVWAIVGALVLGFYDGVSGAGGGVLMLLVLSLVFRFDMKTLIFCANILSGISLAAAGVTFWYLGLLHMELLAVMIPACFIAGALGAKVTQKVPERILRRVFAVLILVLLLYLLNQQLGSDLINLL